MNKFIAVIFAALLTIAAFIIPSMCSAQSVIVYDCRVQKCYTILFPFPHSRCECVERYHYPFYTPRHKQVPPRPRHHPPPPHSHHRQSARR